MHIQELRDQNIAVKNNPNEPIAVAEDLSSDSSSCIIAVGEDDRNKVVVLFFRYTVLYTILEPEPTQDKAVLCRVRNDEPLRRRVE